MAATGSAPRRKDAQRNREAIMCAARELFAESSDVPMYEIARRAGVGQATLYRNFPDRGAIAAAIAAEHLTALEGVAAGQGDDPNAFVVLLRAAVEAQARCSGLLDVLHQRAGGESALERVERDYAQLLEGPLRNAKAAGRVRGDLTIDDVFLLIAMVEGALREAADAAARAAAAQRVLALVLDGLEP